MKNIDVIKNISKLEKDSVPITDEYIRELFSENDGDTSNPRDYYTREEMDTKVDAIEEVINANKTSIQLALEKSEQAFQRGDEVKTQLVDKLISEGLEVSTNNTFEELISNISLKGKTATGVGDMIATQNYFSVSGLDFKPSMVIVQSDFGSNRQGIALILGDLLINKRQIYIRTDTTTSKWYEVKNVASNNTVYISNDGFCVFACDVANIAKKVTWFASE